MELDVQQKNIISRRVCKKYMGLFRKNLSKEIIELERELLSPNLQIPDNWAWWDKKDIKLHEIEAIDIIILNDIVRLHKAGKLNSMLTSRIVSLAKELRDLIVKMMRQQDPPQNLQSEEAQRTHLIVEGLDNLINSSLKKLLGGKMIGPGNWHLYYHLLKITEDDFDLSEQFFDRILVVDTPFTHPAFYSNLPSNVRDTDVLKLYVINTIKFVEKPFRKDVDGKYVLFYRRTQQSTTPKPEAYWTYNFNVAVRGMDREHSVEFIKTSVILVADFKTLVSYQGIYEDDLKDDSIHFIREYPFSQELCLCVFKQ